MTEKEMLNNKRMQYSLYRNLKNIKKTGVLVRSELKGGDLHVNFYENQHTLVIGATGSGKTTSFVIPAIQVYAKTSAKPSMVITDPKGELHRLNAKMLKDAGYTIKVLDLKEPYASAKWNPLERAYNVYNEAMHIREKVKQHHKTNPADLKLKITSRTYYDDWWEFEGVAYADKALLENDVEAKRQSLMSIAFEDLKDIAMVIAPVEAKGSSDPYWDRSAQEFILAVMTAMLEDTQDPKTGMTKEKFNFYNVNKICSYRDDDADAKYDTLKRYFSGRDQFSNAMALANNAINNAPRTSDNIFGLVTNRLSLFNDLSMCYVTSSTELDFSIMDESPTAFFIKVPDDKETRHPLATICISQIYKTLVHKADKQPGGKLKTTVHFLLEEFANIPKIERMDSIITVSRGRNIFLHPIIQSYKQLEIKYGADVANTLRSNCNIHIYIGTNDRQTQEEFSKRCGNKSVESKQTSENKGSGKESGTSKGTSTSIVSRPLVYPEELEHLGKDTFIVSVMNEFPMKVKITPSYKTPMFELVELPAPYAPSKYLDEAKIFFDIKQRNDAILGSSRRRPDF